MPELLRAQPVAAYAALIDPAIPVKAPAQTPLVTIINTGKRLVAAGLHGVIISSADDGVTWKQAAVPVDVTLTDLYFASPSQGWAVGHYGIILQTGDGGTTWSKALDGLDVIKALDSTAAQAKTTAPANPDTALKMRVATAYDRAGPSKPFLAAGACDGGTLVAGQQDMAMLLPGAQKHWAEWTSNIANPNFLNIYGVVSEGATTFLVGEAALVLKSAAGCQNFLRVSGPFTGTLFGGLWVRPGTLIVYGLDGGVFKSSNDGTSWTTYTMPNDDEFVAGIRLKSGDVLLATLGGRFYLSDTQVASFHLLSTTEPFEAAAMAQAENGNVVVVGNGGVGILRLAALQE